MDKDNRGLKIKYIMISLLILIVSLLISMIINSLYSTLYESDNQASLVFGLIEGVVASIAAGLVLYQLKLGKQAELHQILIEEASFTNNYNKFFLQDENMISVEQLLENQVYYDDIPKEIITEETRQLFINYLVYLEGLAPLLLNGILSLEYVDNLMSFRFFLAMDNLEIQEKQLIPYPDYYLGCFKVYVMWREYRESLNRSFPDQDCKNKEMMRPLNSIKCFEEIVSRN